MQALQLQQFYQCLLLIILTFFKNSFSSISQMAPFCYWEVYKQIDFYILLGIGCIASLILIYIARQFIKIIRVFKKIAKKVLVIYLFSLLWAIFYVFKIVFLLLEYGLVLQYSEEESDMLKISQLFCLIDTLTTFFLMYLLILVPYFWLNNITNFLQRMRRNQKKDKLILRFFQIYIYLRLFIFVALFIAEVSFTKESIVSTLCQSLIIIILCEVFLSFCLLCYGVIKLFRNFSSLNVNDKKEKRKFRNEYLIMIGCCFMRFAMDFYFIILGKTESETDNCFTFRSQDYTYTILYIVLGETFMHLAPIITILSIYRIDFKVFNSLSLQ